MVQAQYFSCGAPVFGEVQPSERAEHGDSVQFYLTGNFYPFHVPEKMIGREVPVHRFGIERGSAIIGYPEQCRPAGFTGIGRHVYVGTVPEYTANVNRR